MKIMTKKIHRVLILDFGSQTTQLIARRVRELKVYCEIHPFNESMQTIRGFDPKAIILSGGPASISESSSPQLNKEILSLGIPILGICYGMQALVRALGGHVCGHELKEFGLCHLKKNSTSRLMEGVSDESEVWMSHGDQISQLPENFVTTAQSRTCPHAVIEDQKNQLYGVQFHPEVIHTKEGQKVFEGFLLKTANIEATWEISSFVEQKLNEIREKVGDGHVLMGLSGGVDSSVAAALINKAVGRQLTCVFVDHGLNREGETEVVERLFGEVFNVDLRIVNAKDQFMTALSGVVDPEAKRKIIGKVFIDIFEREAKRVGDVEFLGQGTLYPDVIESCSFHGGPSHVIKSHHNVGGLPEKMKLKLVEPLRELFKDEVRKAGLALGLPESLVNRQPFPGPGLAVRILGEVTKERCDLLRKADAIVRYEIDNGLSNGHLSDKIWQWFAVLLPVKSVGVVGDARTYQDTIAVRCVESVDGMTADWAEIPKSILGRISNRIMNEVSGVSRVVYDISSKPPSTIEWE